jgi:Kef-type K+ transport system membrane component KefB
MNTYYIAAIWLGMALFASFISIRLGVSVALVETLVGAGLGNIPGIREHHPPQGRSPSNRGRSTLLRAVNVRSRSSVSSCGH